MQVHLQAFERNLYNAILGILRHTRDTLGIDELLTNLRHTRDQFFNYSAAWGHRPFSPLAAFAAAFHHSADFASDKRPMWQLRWLSAVHSVQSKNHPEPRNLSGGCFFFQFIASCLAFLVYKKPKLCF